MSRLAKKREKSERWGALPWKPVDLSNENLGEFDDAVFFGLEEIDGSEYQKYLPDDGGSEPAAMKESSKPMKIKKEKKAVVIKERVVEKVLVDNTDLVWDGTVTLHNQLVSSLNALNFLSPTPIQTMSIPLVLSGRCDVVGSAETGSGKTLAFGLPILHSLLKDWETLEQKERHSPYALILAPTRELAVQISTVLNDVCKSIAQRKVQIVNIIGGMSEHKQRRLLTSHYKPVHIIVSTPGRLCDLISDPDLVALQDLSRLRYLVVDEADRMVEDGHFPELFKIFSRIRQHEKLAAEGKDPIQEAQLTQLGTNFDDFENQTTSQEPFEDNEDADFGDEPTELQFDEMPSEEAILAARSEAPLVEEKTAPRDLYLANIRQTLLYSATAMGMKKEENDSKRRRKQIKKEQALAGPKRVAYLQSLGIPEHLRELLETVGVQNTTEVAIATPLKESIPVEGTAAPGQIVKKRKADEEDASEAPTALPAGLKQLEIRVPVEDKDLVAYAFLLKVNQPPPYLCLLTFVEPRPNPHLRQQHQDRAAIGRLAQGT
jgi:hypothetical protein